MPNSNSATRTLKSIDYRQWKIGEKWLEDISHFCDSSLEVVSRTNLGRKTWTEMKVVWKKFNLHKWHDSSCIDRTMMQKSITLKCYTVFLYLRWQNIHWVNERSRDRIVDGHSEFVLMWKSLIVYYHYQKVLKRIN